jgi:5-methylcytosine-specific restriction endonuclease McrA
MKLRTVVPRVQMAESSRLTVPVIADRRITGRALQSRRYAVWLRDPRCAVCSIGVLYPRGFELDHKVRLADGGEDTEENCQVLCVRYELINGERVKAGCHAEKTAAGL